MVYQGFFEILMITLISSKKLGGYKIVSHTVLQANSAGNCSGIRAGWAIQWRGEYENEGNSHPL